MSDGRIVAQAGDAGLLTYLRSSAKQLQALPLVRRLPDRIGRAGAEGLYCACSGAGLAIAVKVEDGACRAILPAVVGFLEVLGVDTGDLGIASVENSRGECVGVVRIRPKSRVPKSRPRV